MWMNNKEMSHGDEIKNGDSCIRAHFTLSGARLKMDQISVICRADLSVCRIVLEAPSFAKVGGILGTYNYEAFDEWTMPNREVRQLFLLCYYYIKI